MSAKMKFGQRVMPTPAGNLPQSIVLGTILMILKYPAAALHPQTQILLRQHRNQQPARPIKSNHRLTHRLHLTLI